MNLILWGRLDALTNSPLFLAFLDEKILCAISTTLTRFPRGSFREVGPWGRWWRSQAPAQSHELQPDGEQSKVRSENHSSSLKCSLPWCWSQSAAPLSSPEPLPPPSLRWDRNMIITYKTFRLYTWSEFQWRCWRGAWGWCRQHRSGWGQGWSSACAAPGCRQGRVGGRGRGARWAAEPVLERASAGEASPEGAALIPPYMIKHLPGVPRSCQLWSKGSRRPAQSKLFPKMWPNLWLVLAKNTKHLAYQCEVQ